MLPLVYVTGSVIEIIKWFGMWLEMMVGGYGITKGWLFQNIEEERMKIRNIDDGFQQALKRVQIE